MVNNAVKAYSAYRSLVDHVLSSGNVESTTKILKEVKIAMIRPMSKTLPAVVCVPKIMT